MYNCKNCGGNLRFDIPTQRLKCPYCDSDYDCYEIDQESTSKQTDSYSVNVLTCPACGAEIISGDQGAAEFCSYCGSSVVLSSRLRNEKKPQKIIPFKKTSEDCVKAYKAKLSGSIFSPGALKDARFLENFRGIYIPYWSYGFSHKGSVRLSSKHEHRKGDYDITDYYQVSGEIDANYDGILYDASAAFDDTISAAIAPYDPKEMQDFTPSFLSGFYADVSDVSSETYLSDANSMANEKTLSVIQHDSKAGRYPITNRDEPSKMNGSLCTTVKKPAAAMLPVWFLTWRDQDRVAYMAVNGQTGKVAADIPIDLRKYAIGCLILAIPLYFVLNMFISFTAPTTLLIAGIFSIVTGVLYYLELLDIQARDTRSKDRGYQYSLNKKRREKEQDEKVAKSQEKGSAVERNNRKAREEQKKLREAREQEKAEKVKESPLYKLIHAGTIIAIVLAVIGFLYSLFTRDGLFAAIFNRLSLNLILILIVFGFWELTLWGDEELKENYKPQNGIAATQLVAVLAAIINIIHPVSDLIYYGAIIVVYIGILVTLVQMLRKYNLLITRPLPQLHDRGKE